MGLPAGRFSRWRRHDVPRREWRVDLGAREVCYVGLGDIREVRHPAATPCHVLRLDISAVPPGWQENYSRSLVVEPSGSALALPGSKARTRSSSSPSSLPTYSSTSGSSSSSLTSASAV